MDKIFGKRVETFTRQISGANSLNYFKNLLEEFGLHQAKPVCTPWTGSLDPKEGDEIHLLEPVLRKRFHRAVGKIMWTLAERPNLAYTTKELARIVQTPTLGLSTTSTTVHQRNDEDGT